MFVVHASRPENTSGGHDARRLGPGEREIEGYASGPGFFREPITFASKQASKRERDRERERERERAREKASKK